MTLASLRIELRSNYNVKYNHFSCLGVINAFDNAGVLRIRLFKSPNKGIPCNKFLQRKSNILIHTNMTEEELYERCPYNKSHIILKSRMMYHTVKCKKTHRPAHHELASSEHYDEEDDNPRDGSFSSHKNKNATKKVTEEGLELFDVPLPEPEENWDSTETGFSYDPEMKVQSEPLLRCLAVAPKSERKDFRANERRRFFLFDSSSSRYQKGMSRVNNGTGERVPKMSQKK